RRLKSRVAVVGLIAGAGITRFFEKSVIARRKGGSKAATKVLREVITATRPNPPPMIDGDSLTLVLTYGIRSTPLEDLRGLTVPVFVAHGDADKKVPIETADAFVAELLREPTRALRYLIYPGCDHGFFDAKGRRRAGDVLRDFIAWAQRRKKGRSIAIKTPNAQRPAR
ncbi:MAG: prolyl oligopeptidase family serine peptidase, partial [Planctomycetales bacterium]|nr:prolyl oligopeptidase family serine peptidase [Planctomycetales bacterium]